MTYDTIKDISGTALTQRSNLKVDGLRAVDDATNLQTQIRLLDRFPRCTVRLATTTNITGYTAYTTPTNPTPDIGAGYSGALLYQANLAIDGVTAALHDRVFVKAQTNPSENGIYQVEALDGSKCNLMKLATLDAVAGQTDGVHVAVREGTQAGYYQWTSTVVRSGRASLGADFMRFDIDDWYVTADGLLTGKPYGNYVNAWKRAHEAAEEGGTITFNRQHTYGFDSTVEIYKTSTTWSGPNRGRQASSGGRLYFAGGLGGPGIRIRGGQGSTFEPVYPGGYPTSSANCWAKLEGLEIEYGGSNVEVHDYHGIEIRHNCHVEECCVSNWPGNAIDLQATAQGGQSTATVALVTTAAFPGAAPGAVKIQVSGTGTSSQPKVFFENSGTIPSGTGGTGAWPFVSSGLGGPFLAPIGTLSILPVSPTGITSASNAAAALAGSYRSNANLTSITRCRLLSAGRWGLYVAGSDVNACVITGVDATSCAQRVLNGELAGAKATCTATLNCDSTHGPYTVGVGSVTITEPVKGLKFTNTTAGTLNSSGNLALSFQAVAVGDHFNSPAAASINVVDDSSTAFGTPPGAAYVAGVTVTGSSVPSGGADAGGGGFFDSAAIGNTYFQCHGAVSAGYTYMSKDPQGANLFVGCYEELPHSSAISQPSQVYGGIIRNASDRGALPGFVGTTASPGVATEGELQLSNADPRKLVVHLGKRGGAEIMSWSHLNASDPLSDPTGYKFQYFSGQAASYFANQAWAFCRAGSLSQTPMALTGPGHFRSHSLVHCPPGILISNVRFGGEAIAAAVTPPATSVTTTGSPNRFSGVWTAGDFFTGTQLDGSGMLKETEPEFWRAISNVSGNMTWRPSRDVRTVADQATLEGSIPADRRMNGSLVHVRDDNSLWQYSSSSTALDSTGILVRRPTDVLVGDPGRWIRCATSVDLKLAISSGTADAATLFTCPSGFRLRLLSAFWETTSSFTGGTGSSIGLSSSNSLFTTKGDILGGAAGDVAAELTAASFGGTIGAKMTSGRTVLKAADTIRFNRITSAFTSGSGFAHVVVQVV